MDYYLALFSLRFVTLPCALNYYSVKRFLIELRTRMCTKFCRRQRKPLRLFFSRSRSVSALTLLTNRSLLQDCRFSRTRAKNTRGDQKFARTNAHSFPAGRKEMGQYSCFGRYFESDMLGCWLASLCSSSKVVRFPLM